MMAFAYQCVLAFSILLSTGSLADITITVLHTNDIHSRIVETNRYGSMCYPADKRNHLCFGGAARRFTAVEKARKDHQNVVLLDGGDQNTGTMWYKVYGGNVTALIFNQLKYDAVVLGNHDFDGGPAHTLSYVQQLAVPVILSNVNVSAEPSWKGAGKLFNHSMVLTRGGRQIGVCSYVLQSTPRITKTGKITFDDEVRSVEICARKHKASGINIIIAVGHAGFSVDKKVAEEVEEVDVVIGGHSNTFLYSGTPPSNEVAAGPYPLVITRKTGSVAVVAQAYAYGKYLGLLKVTFDDAGKVIKWGGNPILLDKNIDEDKDMLSLVNKYQPKVDTRKRNEVPAGKSNVLLDGRPSICWNTECILGNLITDAFVFDASKNTVNQDQWTETSIALFHGGGIRSSIPKTYQESVTYGDILNMLPYEDIISTVEMRGRTLKDALQSSVSGMTPNNGYKSPRLLHVSGLRVNFELNRKREYIVQSVYVLCSACRIPRFEPLEDDKKYKVLITEYLAWGNVGFTMFKKDRTGYQVGNKSDVELVMEYIKTHSPVTTRLEGRLTFNRTYPGMPSEGDIKRLSKTYLTTIAILCFLLRSLYV